MVTVNANMEPGKSGASRTDPLPNGCFTLDREGIIRRVGASGPPILDLKGSVMAGRAFAELILAEDRDVFRDRVSLLAKTGNPQICRARVPGPDGRTLWFRLVLSVSEARGDPEILVASTDITLQQQINDVQSFLQGFGWAGPGMDFFQALSEYLAGVLGMDYVCIDRLNEGGTEAERIDGYFDGQHVEKRTCTLEDIPCCKAVGQQFCCFPGNVRGLFPRDQELQGMGAESYAGVTLFGSSRRPIGLIAVFGRRPLADPEFTETILKQVSARAAGELEQRQMEAVLTRTREELENLIRDRTHKLHNVNKLLRQEIRKGREKAKSLALAEEKYRTVADFTHDWESWYAPDGKFLYVSPSCHRITGHTVEEFMNDPSLVLKITHPDDLELVRKHYDDKLKHSPKACSLDFRIITRDGEERWIGHSCMPVYDSKGNWIGQRGSNRDITLRKREAEALVESQLQLRALTQRMDALAEEQRTSIAREIHDELGDLLTTLKFSIDRLIGTPGLPAEQLKDELTSMNGVVETLMHSVRKIATELRPGILDHLGLISAIEWQLEQFMKRTKITCEYELPFPEESFSSTETNIIYRIVQEILTNIARHSKADKVNVSIKMGDGFLLEITDNGIGFNLEHFNNADSLGLIGMRERATSIGAELGIFSAVGKGTKVALLLKRNQKPDRWEQVK